MSVSATTSRRLDTSRNDRGDVRESSRSGRVDLLGLPDKVRETIYRYALVRSKVQVIAKRTARPRRFELNTVSGVIRCLPDGPANDKFWNNQPNSKRLRRNEVNDHPETPDKRSRKRSRKAVDEDETSALERPKKKRLGKAGSNGVFRSFHGRLTNISNDVPDAPPQRALWQRGDEYGAVTLTYVQHVEAGTAPASTALLRVCRKIYEEAAPIYYGENTFAFSGVASLDQPFSNRLRHPLDTCAAFLRDHINLDVAHENLSSLHISIGDVFDFGTINRRAFRSISKMLETSFPNLSHLHLTFAHNIIDKTTTRLIRHNAWPEILTPESDHWLNDIPLLPRLQTLRLEVACNIDRDYREPTERRPMGYANNGTPPDTVVVLIGYLRSRIWGDVERRVKMDEMVVKSMCEPVGCQVWEDRDGRSLLEGVLGEQRGRWGARGWDEDVLLGKRIAGGEL